MTSLSNSVLWQRMEEYYDNLGPQVWEEEVVPLQITSNTYLANCYAKLIIAQINDYITKHGTPTKSQPFYILEMGCGHAKFSYYLLKTILSAFEKFDWPTEWLYYVMTDISEKNIELWKNHPSFEKYYEANCLDYAKYNAAKDETLHLMRKNQTLKAGDLTSPIFVICNYIFDTLPQDAFQVIDGKLHELELVIKKDVDRTNNKVCLEKYFKQFDYTFKPVPVSTDYYDNPELNKILAQYETEFAKATFLMPVGAFQCIENIKALSSGPLVVLASDKGVSETDLFDEDEPPEITLHGSVSMLVNFDALSQYTQFKSGSSYLMGNKGAEFQVALLIQGAEL